MTSHRYKRIAPKLRFSGFQEKWQTERLCGISDLQRGRFSPRPRNNPIYYNGDIPFVQTSDVVGSNGRIKAFSQTLNEKGLAVSKLFPRGTILITIAANIGYAGVLEIDMACPDSLIGLIPNSNMDKYFINYVLANHQGRMEYLAPEGAQKNINIDFLRPYRIAVPSLPEQQKIAAFLSAVDQKIQQLTKKQELLEQYKKGVMLQLFSGQLRFKDEDGNDFPDWEEKRLGECGRTFNGLTGKSKDDFGEGLPFIQYMQIFKSSKIDVADFGLVKISKNENQNVARYGDTFFTTSSEIPKEIATASILLDTIDNVYLNSFCFGYRPNSLKELVPEYSRFLFRSLMFRKKVIPLAQGSTRYNISKTELMKVSIPLPSEQEQQKIACFLSHLEDKIDVISTQITKTKAFKKGLLQQMFV